MSNLAKLWFVGLVFLGAGCGERTRVQGEPVTQAPTKFTRWTETGKTEGSFDTAIVRYVDKKGRRVDLMGAVHIGDSTYYDVLQKRFEAYESVLYELVAPKGTRPQRGRKGGGVVSMLQRGLKSALDLDFQLDAIDYSPKNFVHADLSPVEFMKRMEASGDSMLKIMLRAMLVAAQRQKDGKGSKVTMGHILLGLLSKNRAHYFKFLFAQELDEIEAMLAAFGGKKGERSVIIGERNAAAFSVLDEQLHAGKKRLAIFYGAAHLPDMETRLLARGFRRTELEWVTAWDVTVPAKQSGGGGEPPSPKKEAVHR